ncbi:MAG: hypothetical protein KatS3mg035_0129 [Bacteroidia bacterium]|nr:MAG: hypothetical protein KatS3mg035_0129 [Bacteroidia bacterium]
MENWLEKMGDFYPITLSVIILLIYLWNILDRLERYNGIKSLVGYLIIASLLVHGVAFYSNYGFEDKFWIAWAIRDVFLILLSIILFESPKLAIVSTLFWIGFGIYYGLQIRYVQEGLRFDYQTSSDDLESNPSAELLVILKNNDNSEQLRELINTLKINFKMKPAFPHLKDKGITDLDNCYSIDVDTELDANRVYELLKDSKLIENIEWNETYSLEPEEASTMSLKPVTGYNFINDTKAIEQWALSALEVDELAVTLRKIKPKKTAKIFILDTGVDANHEDLKDNYFSTQSSYDRDTDKHGTHCAGIACSVTNNHKGIASLNYNNRFCKVTSITVLPGGRGTQERIVDGMILAADLGADVISMSLGGPSNDEKQRIYEKAVDYCNQKGAIVVVAAGNSNNDAKNHAPASCSNTITVAAVDDDLKKARFSNYFTEQKFPIAAPGVNILSTVPNNQYQSFNGTSMATPYVASTIGIMKSIQPALTTEKAYEILNITGISVNDKYKVGNFIQPSEAIKELVRKKHSFHWLIEWLIKLFTFKP